ncbi:unnamed protein product [Cuscuta campestris]|uniref:Uncharacterized protein n=1 Tax=Cuscuta campestris TaxID=132261 RepID=A0A484NN84_9ASTE|nr:unnamed protein product [Cuscuta campestris]
MDSTPPPPEPRSRTRSSSRRSKIRRIDVAAEISPSVPNQELFLISPSPNRRTKSRLPENLETVDHVAEPAGARRRRRTRNASSVLASPRNTRRQRKRVDQETMRDFNESELNAPLQLVVGLGSGSAEPATVWKIILQTRVISAMFYIGLCFGSEKWILRELMLQLWILLLYALH